MAAELGNAGSQSNLGDYFAKGGGVAQDYAEAVRFYKMAADQGLATAQLNLGQLYMLGGGVAQDFAEATRWCERAAAEGEDERAKALLAKIRELEAAGHP